MNFNWKAYYPALGFADYSEVYAEQSEGLHISYEDNKVDEIESGESFGIGLRYIKGEETRFGHLNGDNFDDFLKLSKDLSVGLNNHKYKNTVEPICATHHIKKNQFLLSLDEKIELLKNANKAAYSVENSNLIRQVSLSYGERFKKIYFLSSQEDKMNVFSEERVYIAFVVTVVVEKNGLIQTSTEVIGSLSGWEIFDDQDPYETTKIACRRAMQKLDSPLAPTGEMPVILESKAGGTMIHEAIGHSLEADSIQKGVSPVYVGKIGKVVASEKINVYDDPTLKNMRGSFFYDDEGTKSKKTTLIENGVLKSYLYDIFTSKKEKIQSNGHGRRESFAYKPIPRMSNTFISPGKDKVENILSSVQNGLLVRKMGGGQVNPVTGDFVFEVEEGYLLENGKIKNMVRDASLLGNGPEVLMSIDLVGDDIGWGVGTCGKDGQGVPVSDGQPTLRIPKLLVGGQSKN